MLVEVRFYGVYNDFLDRPGVELHLDREATIRDLLYEMSEVLGLKFRERMLTDEGGLHPHVNLSVNEQIIDSRRMDEKLNYGSASHPNVSVLFVPPLMGGI